MRKSRASIPNSVLDSTPDELSHLQMIKFSLLGMSLVFMAMSVGIYLATSS